MTVTALSEVPDQTGLLAPGQMVADRYRVGGLLGEGGMGAVYKVEHIHMRKAFALKVLHAEMCRMPEVLARFEREAVAAGNIEHPNVASATDFGRLAGGSFFLVLEYVDGRSLRDELKRGPIPAQRAIAIMRGIASGVAAAHAKGIVHRDLKPENVMLVQRDGDDDVPKILDFGIARIEPSATATPDGPILTRMGTLIGTPDYMSPEQALGQAVDARTDLYSLGVIFFEMLSGAPPFRGDAVEVIQQHLLKAPAPLPDVEPAVGALVNKLLAKTAADRVRTADDLLAAIDALGAQPVASAARKPRRRTALLAAAILAIPAALAIVLLVWAREPEATAEPVAAPDPAPMTSVRLDMPAVSAWEPATPAPDSTNAQATTAATVAKTKTTPKNSPPAPPPKKRRGVYIPPPSEWFR